MLGEGSVDDDDTRCIMMCMRTNIVLNDELLTEAMEHTTVKSKRAVIEEALKTFVEVKTKEKKTRTYVERLKELENALSGVKLRKGPFDVLREDRNRR